MNVKVVFMVLNATLVLVSIAEKIHRMRKGGRR